MPDHSQFSTDRTHPGEWTITFSNPPINMFLPATIVELGALMTNLEADPSVKVVVFQSANPDFFIAHLDVAKAAPVPRRAVPRSAASVTAFQATSNSTSAGISQRSGGRTTMPRGRRARHETVESSFADSVCSCGCSRGIRADSRATRLQRTCDTISD